MKKTTLTIAIVTLIVAIVVGYYNYRSAKIAEAQLEISKSQIKTTPEAQSTNNGMVQTVQTNNGVINQTSGETKNINNSKVNQVNNNTTGTNIGENNGTITINH